MCAPPRAHHAFRLVGRCPHTHSLKAGTSQRAGTCPHFLFCDSATPRSATWAKGKLRSRRSMAAAADRSDGIRVSDEPGGDGIRVRGSGGGDTAAPRAATGASRSSDADPRQGTAAASPQRRRRDSSDGEDGSLSLGEILLMGATVFVLVALAARVQNLYTFDSVVGSLFGGGSAGYSPQGGGDGPQVQSTELSLRISLAEAYTGVTKEVGRSCPLPRRGPALTRRAAPPAARGGAGALAARGGMHHLRWRRRPPGSRTQGGAQGLRGGRVRPRAPEAAVRLTPGLLRSVHTAEAAARSRASSAWVPSCSAFAWSARCAAALLAGAGGLTLSPSPLPPTRRCEHCQGTGRVPVMECPRCGGKGMLRASRTVQVAVPPGVESGHTLVVPRAGNQHPGATAGDVVMRVVRGRRAVQCHPSSGEGHSGTHTAPRPCAGTRDSSAAATTSTSSSAFRCARRCWGSGGSWSTWTATSLWSPRPRPPTQVRCPALKGRIPAPLMPSCCLPPPRAAGAELVFPGEGMPHAGRSGGSRGKLVVHCHVVYPKRLSAEQASGASADR